MTDLAIDIHFRLLIHLHVKEGSGVSGANNLGMLLYSPFRYLFCVV
jgi:hypothetical protein